MRYLILLLSGILSLQLSVLTFADTPAKPAAAPVFTLTTDAFLDTGALPVLYTCDGKDVSPHLSWTTPPAKTQSFAIIVDDKDAPNGVFYHWVVFNLSGDTKDLPEGTSQFPPGTIIGLNSWKKAQYNGPCPPKGSVHTYWLTLYALDTKLSLGSTTDGKMLEEAMKNHTLGTAKLSMVYSRWLR